MGKKSNRLQNRSTASLGDSSASKTGKRANSSQRSASGSDSSNNNDEKGREAEPQVKLRRSGRSGILWVFACAFVGGLLGYGIGSGWLTGAKPDQPGQWRLALGIKIRSTSSYHLVTARQSPSELLRTLITTATGRLFGGNTPDTQNPLRSDPSHPRVFAVLREAVVREKGGYVHHDLGPMVPAPCGAARGLGMVRSSFHKCQTTCMPGIASEKLAFQQHRQPQLDKNETRTSETFKQEEVLLRIPLGFQMTRAVALEKLLPIIPNEIQRRASLHELDDAALLVLLLAHERGVGRFSRWLPYIASLPTEPSCGYSKEARPYMLDAIEALREELNLDVNGWPGELLKATQYSERIANGLMRDYGKYLKTPNDTTPLDNIKWALCQVASRATAGSEKHGSLRLVPVMDMINHDASAGGFVELSGKERLEHGDFVDATEEDSGTFVVRSLRHGRRKALRQGQELLVNYNVPHYSPLDWLVSLGFVPPERWGKWQKVDAALPRIRRDGPFAEEAVPSATLWSKE